MTKWGYPKRPWWAWINPWLWSRRLESAVDMHVEVLMDEIAFRRTLEKTDD